MPNIVKQLADKGSLFLIDDIIIIADTEDEAMKKYELKNPKYGVRCIICKSYVLVKLSESMNTII